MRKAVLHLDTVERDGLFILGNERVRYCILVRS